MRKPSLAVSIAALPIAFGAFPARADDPAPKVFTWTRGDPPKVIGSSNNDLCLLTSISGNFAGAGEQLSVQRQGDNWVLTGTSGQSQLRAQATCISKSFFPAYANNPKGLVTRVYDNHVVGNCEGVKATMPDSPVRRVHMISSISGRWRGSGEFIGVLRKKLSTGSFIAQLDMKGCSGYVGAALTSVENKSKKPFALVDKNGAPKPASTFTNSAVWVYGPKSKTTWETISSYLPPFGIEAEGSVPPEKSSQMTPVSKGFCGLTHIRGKFQGYGESVSITQGKGSDGQQRWILTATILAEDASIYARAACISREQPLP